MNSGIDTDRMITFSQNTEMPGKSFHAVYFFRSFVKLVYDVSKKAAPEANIP